MLSFILPWKNLVFSFIFVFLIRYLFRPKPKASNLRCIMMSRNFPTGNVNNIRITRVFYWVCLNTYYVVLLRKEIDTQTNKQTRMRKNTDILSDFDSLIETFDETRVFRQLAECFSTYLLYFFKNRNYCFSRIAG